MLVNKIKTQYLVKYKNRPVELIKNGFEFIHCNVTGKSHERSYSYGYCCP
jgi:hypothetical protein